MSGHANATRRPIPRRRKILYSAIVLIVVLALAEIVSRGFVAAFPNARWIHESVLIDTVGLPDLNAIMAPDAELFWRLRPNVDRERISGRIGDSGPLEFTVSTNREGRRLIPPAPDAAHTILFLGDSCTFGVGVEDGEAFPALLQRRLPATRCVNGGVPGYSSYQGLQLLEELDGDPPDVVVASFLFNDDSRWDARSDIEHGAALQGPLAWLVRNSRLASMLAGLKPRKRPDEPQPRRVRLTDEEYREQLRAIVAHCRATGSIPVLLLWPKRDQRTTSYDLPKQDVMRRVARELDVELVDLVPSFRGAGRPLHLDIVHANLAGHALVADRLEPVLREALAGR